ncbi:MAG: hypothetical protein Aurels2KO_12760 [Aureliella sp.]
MPGAVQLCEIIAASDFEAQEAAFQGVENIPADIRADCLEMLRPTLDGLIATADEPLAIDLGNGSVADVFSFELHAFRSAIVALCARAEEEIYYDDQPAARQTYQSVFKLANGVQNKGLWIHHLVGIASRSIALDSIYRNRRHLNATSRKIVARSIASELEPLNRVNQRERAWAMNVNWYNHLCVILNDLGSEYETGVATAHYRDLTLRRLLAIELTINNAIQLHGQPPEHLQDLSELDIATLVDPYSATGELFRYRVEGDTYQLYSVGPDGRDDGGTEFLAGFLGSNDGVDMDLRTFMGESP